MVTSPLPADPPLSLEPVLGWRAWRLQRIGGVLTLCSLTRPDGWPPKEPMDAKCANHRGTSVPNQGCTCGLYAAATPEDLARSRMLNPDTCVVGAIAMWGTVVEHERGARSRFAYPARLRLVCGPCLAAGAGAVDPKSVVDTAGALKAVCARHRKGITGTSSLADHVQLELLSTYGVDLMPIERIARSLRFPSNRPAPSTVDPLKNAGRAVLSLVRMVFLGLFWLWAMSGLLALAAILVGDVVNTFIHGLDPSAAAATVSPVAVTHLVVPPKDDLPDRGTPPPPAPAFAIVCGLGEGDTVRIAPCDIPGDLVGFAELSAPRGAAHDCIASWDAYSRGNNYWICWTDFRGPLSVHPWASAPNPWSIPVEEGGAIHEHR
jgi:hypothetical protein